MRRPQRPGSGGFTLVEVMIALAIVALTSVVLLDRRVEVVRDAGRSRDLRLGWMLASQKLAELELDDSLWTGLGGQSHGDFSEIDPGYSRFKWEYLIQRHPVDVEEPLGGPAQEPAKPRELMRITLVVKAEGDGEPLVIEAQFPVFEAKVAAPEKPEAPGKEPGAESPGVPKGKPQ